MSKSSEKQRAKWREYKRAKRAEKKLRETPEEAERRAVDRKKRAEEARLRRNKVLRRRYAEKRIMKERPAKRRVLLAEWEKRDSERTRMKATLGAGEFRVWCARKSAERRKATLQAQRDMAWNDKWGELIKQIDEAEREMRQRQEDDDLGKIAGTFTKRQYEGLVRLALESGARREAKAAKLAVLPAKYIQDVHDAVRETSGNGEIKCRFHRRHVEGEDTWIDIAKNREVWTDVVYELFHNANDY